MSEESGPRPETLSYFDAGFCLGMNIPQVQRLVRDGHLKEVVTERGPEINAACLDKLMANEREAKQRAATARREAKPANVFAPGGRFGQGDR
jgi:hypothetical protein